MRRQTRRIVVLVVPPIEELDLVGPVQVFGTVNRAHPGAYHVQVVSTTPDGHITGESGLTLVADAHYDDAASDVDSLLVICGVRSRHAADPALMCWLAETSAKCARVGAVCVGAFLLARAGILSRHRATVHWKYAHEFARMYPGLSVDPNPIWVQDGRIYTSSGFSAGIDLALAWVEQDLGASAAGEAARELVLFLRRPGTQTQVSVSLEAQAKASEPIRALQVWIADNLSRDLTTPILADRVAMSVRNFTRVFAADIGTTPARYVQHVRVEGARRLIATTRRSLDEIARDVGFSDAGVMRRAFLRVLGRTPMSLRQAPSSTMPSDFS